MSSNFLPSDLFNFTEFVIQETIKAPIIDAIIPEDAIIKGKRTKLSSKFPIYKIVAPKTIDPIIDPIKDSNKSAPIPATSPTLSPTLSE